MVVSPFVLGLPFATVRPATSLPFTFAISCDLGLAGSGWAGIRTEAGGGFCFDVLLHLSKLVNEWSLQQREQQDLDLGAMAAIQGYDVQEEDRRRLEDI